VSRSRALDQPKPDLTGVGSGEWPGGPPAAALSGLEQKLGETRELVTRLRGANERLAAELQELKGQLPAGVGKGALPVGAEAELERLRREREEIRQRVLRMLQRLEDV